MDVDDESDSSSSSLDDGETERKPSAVKLGKRRAVSPVGAGDDADALATSLWPVGVLPDHVPAYLPPFPGVDGERDGVRRPARTAGLGGGGEVVATAVRAIGLDDGRVIPYEGSQLAESH